MEFATASYRGSESDTRGKTVSARSGRNASGLAIVMRRVPAYCVRGEVRDASGSLLSRAAITLEADSWSAAVFNEGGRFLLTSLPAGSYTLTVSDGPPLRRVLARQTVHVTGRDIAGLVITAPEG